MIRRVFVLAAALSIWTGGAIAEDYSAGTMQISQPWTRVTPKGQRLQAAT